MQKNQKQTQNRSFKYPAAQTLLRCLVSSSVLWALGGCGQKDPLADQPDYIRNATPGFSKPTPAVATCEKSMVISSNQDHFIFSEQVEAQVTLTGRILLDDYDAELAIDNMDEFPGAKFDPATGIFIWAPPKSFVNTANYWRDTILRVRLNGRQTTSSATSTCTRDYPLSVSRSEGKPTIAAESNFPLGKVREGSSSVNLIFTIKDVDSADKDGFRPTLFLQSPTAPGLKDLTPYLKIVDAKPIQNSSDPTLWDFRVNLNLVNQNLTKSSDNFGFRVFAVSRYGKRSDAKDYSMMVFNSLYVPQASTSKLEFRVGAADSVSFEIFDPLQEGKLSYKILNPGAVPEKLKFACVLSQSWLYRCQATWDLSNPTSVAQKFELRLQVTSSSQSSLDADYNTIIEIPLTFQGVTP